MRLFRNECLEAKIEADRGRSRRSVAVTSKREPDEGAMVTTKREEEELSEAKREIEQLKRELAKYRDEEEDEEDVAGGKAKSESEGGVEVARLPTEVWTMVAAKLDANDVLAFALTSKQHREAQQQAGMKLVTRPCYRKESGTHRCEYFSRDWCASWSRHFNMTETKEKCMNRVIRIAACFGYLDVLETYWSDIPKDKIPLVMDKWTCALAASGGHLETLQWLRSQGCAWDYHTCAWAASNGRLKCLQWARSQGCPWDEDTCFWAARDGHFECLQWARENGCPWYANLMCDDAAEHGRLAVLKWVRGQGFYWDEATTLKAAMNGHLKCFRWLIFKGCPWNTSACRSSGKPNIKQWIREQEDIE